MLPSLAAKISPEEAARLITSDDFLLQEKADGMRIMLGTSATGAITLLNRSGNVTKVPRGTVLPTLPKRSWIDFEFLSKQRFWVGLDLLHLNGNDYTLEPAEKRYRILATTVEFMGDNVGLIRCAFTLQEKLDLITTLKAERGEGVIFKHRDRPYSPGKILAGGPLYKDPWRKRLDAIAFRLTDTASPDAKKSFELYAYNDAGILTNLGRVNAQDHWDAIVPGKFRVVEIDYLYASADRRLVQPVIIGYRDDKPPRECLDTQIQVGGRHAVLTS